MLFIACGLNHKTAPLALREQAALSSSRQTEWLDALLQLPGIYEAVVLSTCNRTEIYCIAEDPDRLLSFFIQASSLSKELFEPHFYFHSGQAGIAHALRVASGLDSMMLGEPQILGQMKQAFQQASSAGTVKKQLRAAFEFIFGASKRIRNESGIGNNPVSIAYAAVHLVAQLFKNPKTLKVFLIGSGETATLVAKYLYKAGVRQFLVAGRTRESAEKLAVEFNGQALCISEIPSCLSQADVVISATACPLPFIDKTLVTQGLETHPREALFLLDLAVPRDIEADVAEISGVHLYNIDDLQSITDSGMQQRQQAALKAELLIETELENYRRHHKKLKAGQAISLYRNHMESLTHQELQRALSKLSHGIDQERVLREFAARLLNKLAHQPTAGLQQAALDGRDELLDLTHYLFNPSDSVTL